jgi:hypothetical protein
MVGLAVLPVRSERVALLPRETELWPDLLKDSFNCPDLVRMVSALYSSVVNGGKTLPFGGRIVTSLAKQISSN